MYDKPVIIQGNGTLLLDLHHPACESARDLLLQFCELEKSPEHIHTYQLTSLSLWNASAANLSAENVIQYLRDVSRYEVPGNIITQIKEIMGRYGQLILNAVDSDDSQLQLNCQNERIWREIQCNRKLSRFLIPEEAGRSFLLAALDRGAVKVELIRQNFPVVDLAPITEGAPLQFQRRSHTRNGREFQIRHYQEDSIRAFLGDGSPGSGFGSIVLPCGAGKTIVGILAMLKLQTETLILTPNVTALHQWITELQDKTELRREDIAEYSGAHKEIGPVTIATYQVLTWHSRSKEEYPHFSLFRKRQWGLIIYDEVHMLPAPVFRIVAEIQSVRRLGLTATLIREDHEEDAVFSLVGPKRYDVPWKELERNGWIARAICREMRIELPQAQVLEYAVAEPRQKIGIAARNILKEELTADLLQKHKTDKILIIGQYIRQLEAFSKRFNAPIITGQTSNARREILYDQLRNGEIRLLIVSKVANFAIDLPDVNVAIQISGSFGSRQEEAQRLGRILRPKKTDAHFYSIISRYTVEEEFSANRQKFLIEQGYTYEILTYEAAEYPLSAEQERLLRQGARNSGKPYEMDALEELHAAEDTVPQAHQDARPTQGKKRSTPRPPEATHRAQPRPKAVVDTQASKSRQNRTPKSPRKNHRESSHGQTLEVL